MVCDYFVKFTFADSVRCDYFYYYNNGIVEFTFADSMDCDFFYYYNDGIAESTYFGLEWFLTTFIVTTMELLSLPFVDSDGLRLLSGLTFCGGELCITLSE